MTVDNMLTLLGYELDDTTPSRYTNAVKLRYLNDMQNDIAMLVHTDLLRAAQTNTDIAASGTGNTVPSNYFRWVSAKLYQTDPERWFTKISMEDLSKYQDNRFSKGSTLDPIAYTWGSNIFFILNSADYGSSNGDVRLYYIKTLTTLAASGTCDLHPSLHLPLVNKCKGFMALTYKYGDPQVALAKVKDADAEIASASLRAKNGELR